MKINISPGMIIMILGLCLLVLILAESPGKVGSKIPLAMFFVFIIVVGITIEIYGGKKDNEHFGEMEDHQSWR